MEDENYIKEKNLKNGSKAISISQVDILSLKAKENICKIHYRKSMENTELTATGFFCSIPNGSNGWNSLKVLITNNHVLNKNDISIDKIVKFSLNNEKNFYEIKIDKFRKVYTDKTYDITIIELKEQDKLENISFFDIDNRIFREDFKELLLNEKIILLHYPQGIEMKYSDGNLININDDNFTIRHSCDSIYGSSGGPIINLIDYKVIGIHKGGNSNRNYNLGTFLKAPLEDFYNKNDILPKVECHKNNKTIDNFLNPQQTKKKEYKKKNEDSKLKISAFDKIYFIYAPEVNLNSKRFNSPVCCCFSFSIETLIIIHFVLFVFEMLIGLQKSRSSWNIKNLLFILLSFLCPLFLFFSTKNHNYGFARVSLYLAEILGLKYIKVSIECLKDYKIAIFEGLEEYCKDDDPDLCFSMFIGLVLGLILELLFIYDQFYFIYLAYYQLSLIQYKNAKKLE